MMGMWFQDLFNYDFATEMCTFHTPTQQGEISFLRVQHGSAGENH